MTCQLIIKKIVLISIAPWLLFACSPQSNESTRVGIENTSAEKLAETDFSIDYEKFILSNGLEVILHRDNSDPIVAVTTVVHVGSNREKPGRTGFAHFFEHMAFNDSENVPRGWNRKAIPDWGGSRNGGTWSDGTIYYEVVPKDAFDKILWIDSDRLGYMINTVTQAALEREKQVVKNEKRQRVDNAAYGYTQEVIRKNLYPNNHPYNWTVIGALPDLQAATLKDVKEFHKEFYGPNNATLVIAGDIDLAETKAKVERWFGEIPRGAEIPEAKPQPVVLSEDKKLYFLDNFAKLPELRLTFPSVEAYHRDEKALDVLGAILGGSKNSVLYKTIVEELKLAPGVSSYNNSMQLAGEFVFRVRANAGVDLDAVKKGINQALIKFSEEGVADKDLQRIKAEQETSLYGSFSTVLGKSNQMASDNEFAGDPAYAIKSAELITAVTASDVMRVFSQYIKDKASIITSFVPKEQAELAVSDSSLAEVWIEEVKANVASEEVSQGDEAAYEKTVTKYDRSEPPFGELPLVKMPLIWEAGLTNEISVLGIENSETPLVAFDLTIQKGAWSDELDKKGVASLLARLMNEGTATLNAAEFEQQVGLLGSNISVNAGLDEIRISATTLSKNFEKTAALVHDVLMKPRWVQADFDKVKSAALTSIKGREANPNSIAALNFNQLIYGKEHPLGLPSSGTTDSVVPLTMDDLKQFYLGLNKANAQFHIVGDVNQARAEKAFMNIAKEFNSEVTEKTTYTIPKQIHAGKVFFIDVPGSKQSVLNIGKLAVDRNNSDWNKLNYTNEKLGGGISGDLAQTLRIEKGYTYGAYSSIRSGLVPQTFRIGTSVRANATEPSLAIIRQMLQDYGPQFSAADVELTQNKLVKENTRAFESLGAKLATLQTISKYGKSKKYVEEDQQELVNMTLDDFKYTANKYLNEKDMLYVIVGDKATQFEAVKQFASPDVIELDIYGNRK